MELTVLARLVVCPLVLVLQTWIAIPGFYFYIGARDLNSDSNACAESTLLTEPPPLCSLPRDKFEPGWLKLTMLQKLDLNLSSLL